ncbi:hypothetical protein V9K92_01265 [Phyllobacterium sp. CCNWLW109]|uniref:hypothetical protein n=1 Tax=Phyllobacterium sp. CCNWLW109 TaxID=3127479 RepID=UPI00307772F4
MPRRCRVYGTTADGTHKAWLVENDPHVNTTWIDRWIFHSEYIIALGADGPVGFLRYSWFWGKIPYMDMIYVVPEQRREAGAADGLTAGVPTTIAANSVSSSG